MKIAKQIWPKIGIWPAHGVQRAPGHGEAPDHLFVRPPEADSAWFVVGRWFPSTETHVIQPNKTHAHSLHPQTLASFSTWLGPERARKRGAMATNEWRNKCGGSTAAHGSTHQSARSSESDNDLRQIRKHITAGALEPFPEHDDDGVPSAEARCKPWCPYTLG
jgi:hypothetical protein